MSRTHALKIGQITIGVATFFRMQSGILPISFTPWCNVSFFRDPSYLPSGSSRTIFIISLAEIYCNSRPERWCSLYLGYFAIHPLQVLLQLIRFSCRRCYVCITSCKTTSDDTHPYLLLEMRTLM